jgi:hypothetical protein
VVFGLTETEEGGTHLRIVHSGAAMATRRTRAFSPPHARRPGPRDPMMRLAA